MIYTCALCGCTFSSNQEEDVAEQELKKNFGEDISIEDCDLVCDDCYKKVLPEILN